MILLQISGGLGNQMFQYAAARKLAVQGDGIIQADLYPLEVQTNPSRKYRLNQFKVEAEIAPWNRIFGYSKLEFMTRVVQRNVSRNAAKRFLGVARRWGLESPCRYRFFNYQPNGPQPPLKVGKVVTERQFHFDPEVLNLTGDYVLMGYWQTEKYFADIAPQLRADFQLKSPQQGIDLALAQRLETVQSISLHVRRGDKAVAKDFNGTTYEFCQQAMAWFRARLPDPIFFIFSDDWEWVRQHLPEASDVVHVAHHSAGTDVEDWNWEESMRLMGQCKHHIIAPSSFSWWAAWLNPDPEKIVLSPRHNLWLNFKNCDTRDVIPNSWIQLDV